MTHTRNTPASRPPRRKTTLPADGHTGRSLRARVEPMLVRPLRDDRYVVETEHGTYVVDLDERDCTCPDHAIRDAACKHLRRVAIEVNDGRVPAPGKRTSVCAVCGRRIHVPTEAVGPQLCARHEFAPGDLVRDRESRSLLVVSEVTTDRADEHVTDAGLTVAAFESNANYGGQEPVVEAVYLGSIRPSADGGVDAAGAKRYGFPASRLRRVERDQSQARLDLFVEADSEPATA